MWSPASPWAMASFGCARFWSRLARSTVMVGFSVWGRGPIGTFGACIGLVGGYLASLAIGLVDTAPLDALTRVPLVRLPTVAATFPSFRPTAAAARADHRDRDHAQLHRCDDSRAKAERCRLAPAGSGRFVARPARGRSGGHRFRTDWRRRCLRGRLQRQPHSRRPGHQPDHRLRGGRGVCDCVARAAVLASDPHCTTTRTGRRAGVSVVFVDGQRRYDHEFAAARRAQDVYTGNCVRFRRGDACIGPGRRHAAGLDGACDWLATPGLGPHRDTAQSGPAPGHTPASSNCKYPRAVCPRKMLPNSSPERVPPGVPGAMLSSGHKGRSRNASTPWLTPNSPTARHA